LNAVEWAAGPPPVRVISDGVIELEAYLRNGQILVHLINHTYAGRIIVRGNTALHDAWASTAESVHPPTRVVPLRNVKVLLRGYEISAAHLPLEGKSIPLERKGEVTEIVLPKLEEYAFLVIDLR